MTRAKVRKYGDNRLCIEIPKLYFDKFPAGTVVDIKEVKKDVVEKKD